MKKDKNYFVILEIFKSAIFEYNSNFGSLSKIKVKKDFFSVKELDSLDIFNFVTILDRKLEKKFKKNFFINPYEELSSKKNILFSKILFKVKKDI
tara:strand:- start:157 stop:441 length:285 start_codon:yes stop_codon:yes gene_type:complete